MDLNLAEIRRQFPGLQSDWILLDNAGGSQILGSAIDRAREAFLTSHVQSGGTYAPSRLVAERVAVATHALARFVNADPAEIILGPSTTQHLLNLARAMEPSIRPGDEFIVCDVDHESNIGPWIRLAARGAVIKWWHVDRESYDLRLDDLSRLLTPRTRLLAFAHVSNVLGHVNPAEEAVRLAHAAGAQVLVDGVAFAPHRQVDVRAVGADYYVLSLYKVFGPHQALLYARQERLQELESLNHFFIPATRLAAKLQPGGVNFELVHAAGAIPDYTATLSYEAVARHEAALAERVLSFLRGRRGVRIIGHDRVDAGRLPTVSFTVDGRDASAIPPLLDEHRVGIKNGDFYARRLCDALGLTPKGGVARISMVHYNTLAEMDRLLSTLETVL